MHTHMHIHIHTFLACYSILQKLYRNWCKLQLISFNQISITNLLHNVTNNYVQLEWYNILQQSCVNAIDFIELNFNYKSVLPNLQAAASAAEL